MSVLLSEAGYIGKLKDFTSGQKMQMAKWLSAHDRRGLLGIGLVRSCEAVVNRADRGSSYFVTEKIVKSMIDERTGLNSKNGMEDRLAIAVLGRGDNPCSLMDAHFFNYLDGSITVAYESTGFMIDQGDPSIVIHPETRFAIHLPETEYDLSYSQDSGTVTGRTLFFYRLTQACRTILSAERGATGSGNE